MTLTLPARAIVRAPLWDTYPPLPTAGETAFRELVRAEPCACGTTIRQFAGDDVPALVGRHNDRPAHRAWRERRG